MPPLASSNRYQATRPPRPSHRSVTLPPRHPVPPYHVSLPSILSWHPSYFTYPFLLYVPPSQLPCLSLPYCSSHVSLPPMCPSLPRVPLSHVSLPPMCPSLPHVPPSHVSLLTMSFSTMCPSLPCDPLYYMAILCIPPYYVSLPSMCPSPPPASTKLSQ